MTVVPHIGQFRLHPISVGHSYLNGLPYKSIEFQERKDVCHQVTALFVLTHLVSLPKVGHTITIYIVWPLILIRRTAYQVDDFLGGLIR